MKLQVGVKVLIKNEAGQYLLLQRSESLPDGTGIRWDIPGGRIDASEKLLEALKRELREEIGVDLRVKPVLIAAQDILIADIDLHVVRLTYTAEMVGEVSLGNEHQNYKWVTVADGLKLNTDPYLREVLEDLR
ncbi:MAG TPA: NUDIX domain-containing protein [Candidatus Saccharimonadales bacterium]